MDVLPKSRVSSSLDDVVPHIIVRSPRLKLGRFVFGDAKRLLQHYPLQSGHSSVEFRCLKNRQQETFAKQHATQDRTRHRRHWAAMDSIF